MIMVLATGSDAKSKLKFWIDILRHFLAKIIQKIRFYLVIQCLASSCSPFSHIGKKINLQYNTPFNDKFGEYFDVYFKWISSHHIDATCISKAFIICSIRHRIYLTYVI